jgi:NAD(P)-dependent dehydrogenase (short-subunit alcohol dehydrogenase family)
LHQGPIALAQHGAKVAIGDVNPTGCETVETIKRDGGSAVFVETDVRNAQQVKILVAAA